MVAPSPQLTCSMWFPDCQLLLVKVNDSPHPHQVGFPSLGQVTRLHIVVSLMWVGELEESEYECVAFLFINASHPPDPSSFVEQTPLASFGMPISFTVSPAELDHGV